LDAIITEFVHRLGHLASKWGLGEGTGSLWSILLVTGDAMTQEDLSRASGYSSALVSTALSRLEELGFVVTAGRRGKKRLYLAVISFVDALANFLNGFVSNEITPIIESLSKQSHKISDPKQKANVELMLLEFEKGGLFLTSLLSTMKRHKSLHLGELKQVLQQMNPSTLT